MIIGLIMNAFDADIAAVWQEIHKDEETTDLQETK
jgi:hypothetical protein